MSAWVDANARRVISVIAIVVAFLLAVGVIATVLQDNFHVQEGTAGAIAWFSAMFGWGVVRQRKEILANGYPGRLADVWALSVVALVVAVIAIAEGVGIVLQLGPVWLEVVLPIGVLLIAGACLGRDEDDASYNHQSRPFLGRRFFTSLADGVHRWFQYAG
jgi:hypothetical protein